MPSQRRVPSQPVTPDNEHIAREIYRIIISPPETQPSAA
jgi:hypothetical protein